MVTFRIPTMTCGHCVRTISNAVAGVDPAARVEVDLSRHLVSVTSTASEAQLVAAMQQAGYAAEAVDAAPATAAPVPRSGCCCGPRKAPAVDAREAAASSSGACCG